MSKRITVGIGIGVLFLALPFLPAYGQTIHGCYAKNNGQLRVLAPGQACNPSEIPIDWNVQGEKGDKGDQGDKGETGATGPAGEPAPGVRAVRAVPISFGPFDACVENDKVQICQMIQRLAIAFPDAGASTHELSWTTEQGVEKTAVLELRRPDTFPDTPCASSAVGVVFRIGEVEVHFCLSREAPLYNVKSDVAVPPELREETNLIASYVPDWLILFDLDATSVRTAEKISAATIVGGVQPGYGTLTLDATLVNVGKIEASYVVTVTDSPDILLPEPQTLTLRAMQRSQLSFPIRFCAGASGPLTAKVTLTVRSPTGAIYDSVDVIFDWLGPAPPPVP